MSNTDGEAQQIERCQYELWVNEYFGLPENFLEKATRMDFDYGNLVNMLAMFDVKRNKHHKQNLNDCMNEQDLELASLREQLKESSFWANEQANTLNALADRNAGLSSELEKSNHNYLSIVEQLKQQEEVIRELIPIAEMVVIYKELIGKECKTEKSIIEKAKSLTTKDK